MPTLLSVQELAYSHARRPLFAGLSFGINDGDRIGLIGPNGAGKSTLLQILAGREKPDAGAVSARRGLRVGLVPQEESFTAGATVESTLREALADDPLEESERATRIEIVLAQCGFDDREKPAEQLSGGWRKRLAIAREWIREPDLLLLDEPTNHLDLAGVEWLEGLLEDASFAFLVVTHDRYFLENVVTRLIDLNPAYAEGFLEVDGGYSGFLARRADYFAVQERRRESLQTQARRELAWLRRGAQARSTKAKGRIEDAGELMAELAEVTARRSARQALADGGFHATNRKTRELLVARNVGKALGGRTLFSGLSLTLSPGLKLGIVGDNGSGKTTLLRLLCGDLEPDSGTLRRADGLRTLWFDQDRAALEKTRTVQETLAPESDFVLYRGATLHLSAYVRKFGLREEQLGAQIGTLSGGEQARILIARLMLQSADLLVLDEPTNDLDLESLAALEEGLESFPGALVLVSHDRFFLDKVANQILALGEGAPAFYADYAQWAARRAERAAPAPAPRPAPAAPRPGLTATERRELQTMEETILAAEEKVQATERAMQAPENATDAARLQALWDDRAAAKAAVERLYARWEELEARQAALRSR